VSSFLGLPEIPKILMQLPFLLSSVVGGGPGT
jgi:hypothetical protein